MADSTPKSYHTDPTLYLYTSLTAGSSHIITATSRLETILKANKIPFLALDVATDEKARMLWGRRAGKRKLPGLVRMGMVVGDLEEVEEWNEYGELKDNVGTGAVPSVSTPPAPSTPSKAVKPADTLSALPFSTAISPRPQQSSTTDSPLTTTMRQAGFEAAKKAGEAKSQVRTKVFGDSKTSNEASKKLEHSSAIGMPPATRTNEANSTKAPETESSTAKSKFDTVPAGSGTIGKETLQLRASKAVKSEPSVKPEERANPEDDEDDEVDLPPQKSASRQSTSRPDTSHEGDESSDHPSKENLLQKELNTEPGDVDIVKLLKEQGKTGKPLLDLRKLKTGKTAATAAMTTEEAQRAQPSSGTKTQDQAAGNEDQVGESVGD
ncbi:hypothetical protein MMC29_004855 [Sticta canariensis]|nr:hypothetical protein [Sticta canariensis]